MADSPAPGTPQTPTKAIIAGVIAFLGSLLATLQGRDDNMQILDWLIVVGTALVAALLTYQVPNSARTHHG